MAECTTIIVLGASGDLAKKKTFPALFNVYKFDYMPPNSKIFGYARSKMNKKDFEDKICFNIKDDKNKLNGFLEMSSYVQGKYDENEGFQKLNSEIEKHEKDSGAESNKCTRIFYFAIPPSVYEDVAKMIKNNAYLKGGNNKLVVEKPFGKDTESSRELVENISSLFDEKEIFRIDHYLGKEMVKNIIPMRFANIFFETIWDNYSIDNVQITFKEPFGAEGRGGYFDSFGIIRDVIQNHLIQVLCYIAMERPKSLDANDIRDEKVKLLKAVQPITENDVLIGQYDKSIDGTKPAYTDDDGVDNKSNTPTFAATILRINNPRWVGVPFLLKAGKDVRIQFKDNTNKMFQGVSRNELVIRLQPKEAMYIKFMNKMPGLEMKTIISELDLTYRERFPDDRIPQAYEALILDVLNNKQSNFVRNDELDVAWKIFTPILHKIDNKEIISEKYPYGSRGPASLDNFVEKFGYKRDNNYHWSPKDKE